MPKILDDNWPDDAAVEAGLIAYFDQINLPHGTTRRTLINAVLIAARDTAPDAGGWQPMSSSPKSGRPVLGIFHNPIPSQREDRRIWDGRQFVMCHHGLADNGFGSGWNFAAPVGMGGFPDEWLAGWRELPAPPAIKRAEVR